MTETCHSMDCSYISSPSSVNLSIRIWKILLLALTMVNSLLKTKIYLYFFIAGLFKQTWTYINYRFGIQVVTQVLSSINIRTLNIFILTPMPKTQDILNWNIAWFTQYTKPYSSAFLLIIMYESTGILLWSYYCLSTMFYGIALNKPL